MKKVLVITMVMFLFLAACNSGEHETQEQTTQEVIQSDNIVDYNEDMLTQTFADWVLGSDYGIDEVKIEKDNNVVIVIPEDRYIELQDYDMEDIKNSVEDILSLYNLEDDFTISFSNGESLETESAKNDQEIIISGDVVNLIFIHHSVGENWLNAGLNQMLNDNNFHVADTYYGWWEVGDRTDTADWPEWFSDDVMPTVYKELGNMTGFNSIEPAQGENTIIMFKSCYPNSEVGNSIEDEKQIYQSLLNYFSNHSDKMFVLITPPPMQRISNPEKTRELASWLVDESGWRKDYHGKNLFVFDFYNVLTAEDNHHMLIDGKEQNIINSDSNTLLYDFGGDDHPNDIGSQKAAEEFVPLLNYWYQQFSGE